jgi:RIO kinase 1
VREYDTSNSDAFSADFDAHDHYGADDAHTERARRRGRRPSDDAPVPRRRGRLTEHERGRLAALRADTLSEADAPPNGDRWSTWGQAEHGPAPFPDWVITDLSAEDTELGILKTGKEAEVHLLRRAVGGDDDGGPSCVVAAKRYRAADHRLFHRDAQYLEGRQVRRSRENRAMSGRTAFGRNLIAEQWAVAEFAALGRLWSAGVPVPYPVQREGTELLMEFVGTPDGTAAPRLAQLRPSPEDLRHLWNELVHALATLAGEGLAHGDLSAYNVLVHDGTPVLIDLPQVVDMAANPAGPEFLARDVRNVAAWFTARGLPEDVVDADGVIGLLMDEAGMT